MRHLIFFLLFLSSVAKSQSLTQTIRGTVTDKILKTAIPGTQVILINTDPLTGASTDENGNYRIENVPLGRHTLHFSSLGYQSITFANVEVLSSKELIINVELEEDVTVLNEIVVTEGDHELTNDYVIGSAQLIRPEEVNRFAGARQDPSRMAANYAGVVGGGDQRNDVIVRGNSPNGVLWRLEDTDIPAPNHFSVAGNPGGVFSILNNNLLGNSDFITGAFPAQYGNKTAAVFDLRLRKGNNEQREHTFQAGLNGMELGTEGPIGKNGGSYLVNGRYFYTGLLEALGADLGASGIPKFWDGALKVNLPSKNIGTFSIWAIGGDSHIANSESSEDKSTWDRNPAEDDIFGSHMFASGISHSTLYSPNTFGRITLSFTGNGSSNEKNLVYLNDSTANQEKFEFRENYVSLRYLIDHKVNKNISWHSGVEYKTIAYTYQMKERDMGETNFEYPLDDTNIEPYLSSVFTQLNWRPTEHWQIVTGLYAQLVHINESGAVEPRASIAYLLSNQSKLSFSYGMHSQTHPMLYYRWQTPDAEGNFERTNLSLDLTRSHHFIVGYNWMIGQQWHLKTDLYYQYLYDIPVSSNPSEEYYSYANLGADFSFEGKGNVVNAGKGYNTGIEFTVEKLFNKGFYLLFTGSLFDSQYKGVNGTWFNTVFNSNFVSNFLIGKEWPIGAEEKKTFSVDLRSTLAGNKRFIPIDLEASNALGEEVLKTTEAYADRHPDYFRVDLKLTYTINRNKSSQQILIAADNLTNYKNVYYQEYSKELSKVKTYNQFGIFPYLAYRINF